MSAPQVVAAAVAVCAVLGLTFAAATGRFAGHGREGLTEFAPATVLSVRDGDTLYVRLDTGEEGFVRLIGVDAPESVNPDPGKNTPEGEAAAAFLRSVVSAGQTVYLVRDVSDHDKFGRWLRYVWLEVPEQPFAPAEVRTKMLQGILVAAGHARVTRFAPDTSYYDILVTISYTADRAA
ncbi:MAG: thermonuclease family protein [Eggerthellaceae bacterium]|nr:thermonuclease family protein [Eggerthellaceae bacterium]